MAIKARFKGDGSEFLQGVPARDLDDDEFVALSDEQKAAVLTNTQLYSVRGAKAERDELPEELVQGTSNPMSGNTPTAAADDTDSAKPRGTKKGGE